MADDRYRWLDGEAAERLLRGLPVDARRGAHEQPGRPHQPGTAHEPAADGGAGGDAHAGPRGAGGADAVRDGGHAEEGCADAGSANASNGGSARPHPADLLAAALDDLVAEHTAVPYAQAPDEPGPAPHPAPAGELSGEAAAVDAFRAARTSGVRGAEGLRGAGEIAGLGMEAGSGLGRHAAARGGRGRAAGTGAGAGSGGSGSGSRKRSSRRGDRRPGPARRASLAGRPLRAGFAMAVAGCALGGVAFAAGTGVLPSPFGGGHAPAASVSPLTSPDGGGQQDSALGGESASPHDTHGSGRGDNDADTPSGSASDGSTDGGEPGKGAHDKGREADGRDGKGKSPRDHHGISDSEKKAVAKKLCLAYEEDRLEPSDRRKLERAAGGPAAVHAFCGRHGWTGDKAGAGKGTAGITGGDRGDGSSGGDSGGSHGGGSGGDGSSGGDSGGHGDDGDGDGGGATDKVDGYTGGTVTDEGTPSPSTDTPSPSADTSTPDAGTPSPDATSGTAATPSPGL